MDKRQRMFVNDNIYLQYNEIFRNSLQNNRYLSLYLFPNVTSQICKSLKDCTITTETLQIFNTCLQFRRLRDLYFKLFILLSIASLKDSNSADTRGSLDVNNNLYTKILTFDQQKKGVYLLVKSSSRMRKSLDQVFINYNF